jgi:hypothetical protein
MLIINFHSYFLPFLDLYTIVGLMRFLSTIYISAIAGHLGMTTFYGCGNGGSGRTTNSQ